MKRLVFLIVAVVLLFGAGALALKFHLRGRLRAAELAWTDPFDPRGAPYSAEALQQSRRSIQMHHTAVFIGDSITVGLAASNVAAHSENFGIDGDTIDGLLTRLPGYRLTDARVIVLEIGVNNYHRDGLSNFGAKYRKLLNLVPGNVPVIAMAIFPVNEHANWWIPADDALTAIKKANQEIGAACHEARNCDFLDLSPSFADGNDRMKPIYEVGDGIHLSEAGYKIWADALAHRMPNEN